ncbi:PAR16 polymerase, partial [Atractosteus spatula]|nr:PAR16 polymerase [Atractosteus spatula]
MQQPGQSPAVREAVRASLQSDPVAADLRCSLFVSAAQSYKRDSVLRPFPPRYVSGENKDFDALMRHKMKIPDSLWSLKKPRPFLRNSRGVTPLSWTNFPLPFTNYSLLIIPTYDVASSLCSPPHCGCCRIIQLADVSSIPSVRDVVRLGPGEGEAQLGLVHWVLSSKNFTVKTLQREEYVRIQELAEPEGRCVPAPDFLFELQYCDQVNARFEETRGDRDLIYAFHGSRLENFHSILHNGLHCHLNKARTSLFGEGTYLTSDLSLALLYSPHGNGWHESLLGPVLSCIAVCEIIDHPDVKCQVKKKDSERIDRRRARVRNSEGGDVPQKYFVVTNNQLLRVKYLLVYSEKQHRRR